jgi:2-phospho-L-lactate transferase/gluconeogenesis factor (CofD/UPF0052 family)
MTTEREQAENLKLRRAEAARQVKENPAYTEAWLMVKAALVDKIAAVDTKDDKALIDAVHMLKNLNRLEKVIDSFYDSGKVVISKRSKLAIFNKAS